MGTDEMTNDGLSILIADDNAPNQTLFRVILESAGHHVELANNGLEAVALVQANDYDIVLMDVAMPRMSGLQATEIIRKLGGRHADIPIIALTANAMKGDRVRFLSAGMTDYLTKPIHMEQLVAAVEKQKAGSARSLVIATSHVRVDCAEHYTAPCR